jgi:signal peptide peptidase SppA
MKHSLAHVMGIAFGPWNLTPEMLAVVASVLARHIALDERPADALLQIGQVEAVQAALANRKNLPQPRVGSVAIIPVHGVIAPHASQLGNASNVTSFDDLSDALDHAVRDKGVRTIVFDVDSPGGSVRGNQEFAAEVMRARTKKPIIAHANYLMASAAYQLSAAATEIVAAPSAQVGGIGTYSIHDDFSAAMAQHGVKRTYISAGAGKVDGNEAEPLSEAAYAKRQKAVNVAYTDFVNTVVRGRGTGTTVEKVRDTWGAHVYGAVEAKDLGLIDKIATFDQTLERLLDPADALDRAALATFEDAPVDTPQIREEAGQDRRRELLELQHTMERLQLFDLTE